LLELSYEKKKERGVHKVILTSFSVEKEKKGKERTNQYLQFFIPQVEGKGSRVRGGGLTVGPGLCAGRRRKKNLSIKRRGERLEKGFAHGQGKKKEEERGRVPLRISRWRRERKILSILKEEGGGKGGKDLSSACWAREGGRMEVHGK